MLRPQLNKLRSTRGMLGGVWTPAPINQEGHQPVALPHVGVGESPREHLPVALLPLAASHLAQLQPGVAGLVDSVLEVLALGGPGDEAWGGEIVQAKPARAGGRRLRGIRADELQVHGPSEADQSVPRPLTYVAAARARPDTDERLEAIDLLFEVASTPDEVIDRRQWRRSAQADHPKGLSIAALCSVKNRGPSSVM